MNKEKEAILIGTILGDGYLQKTGRKNARLRFEHSTKQKEDLLWKASKFPEFFQGKPKRYVRFNRKFGKTYKYLRFQSNSSPQFGEWRRKFYRNSKRVVPTDLQDLLTDPLSLAVWFMDDGYLYRRDKMAYIYLPEYSGEDIKRLVRVFERNFGLKPRAKVKKTGSRVLVFPVKETKKLIALIKPFVIPSMNYKTSLDPVSTEVS